MQPHNPAKPEQKTTKRGKTGHNIQEHAEKQPFLLTFSAPLRSLRDGYFGCLKQLLVLVGLEEKSTRSLVIGNFNYSSLP
jgi:hypothetical protein